MIPIHLPGHWTLLAVNLLNKTYSYTDTLDLAKEKAPPEILANIEWWLSSVLDLPHSLRSVPRHFETDKQLDSISCGIAVMTTMSHIALSTPSWRQSQAAALRMEWFMKLTRASGSHKVNNETTLVALPSQSSSVEYLELSDSDSVPGTVHQEPPSPCSVTKTPAKQFKQSKLLFPKAEDDALEEIEAKINEEKLLKKRLKANEKKQRQWQKKNIKLANNATEQ
ncbi:hypothetical protein FRC11_003810, partial [Ceratobasidium sp. 423]